MLLIDIWKYHTKKQIKLIFNFLSKLIIVNNDFFHYTDYLIKKYLNNLLLDYNLRFLRFYISWINFQNKKRIILRFNKTKKLIYPQIFELNLRIVVDTFLINYSNIIQDINCYRALNKKIPYSYLILIKKLIKNIIFSLIYKNKKIDYLINLKLNIVTIILYITLQKVKTHTYKIDKLLFKYQKKYPKKYLKCKAHLVISSNWKDLLLQSTFKQWTSCINLFVISSDLKISYSMTNGIKAGNLVAYCIYDLDDGLSILLIMDDNGYHGLMYLRCFWRCSIKRYVNKLNYNNYLFCALHTSYGTIIQNSITYNYKLFSKINEWLIDINKETCKINNLILTFKLPYTIYSDLHSFNIEMENPNIYLFNYNITNYLSAKDILKIKLHILFNLKLFSNDILAILSVFNYFQENNLTNLISLKLKRLYIINNYMLNKHFVLNNSYITKKLLKIYK